jgi:hypothetical protein
VPFCIEKSACKHLFENWLKELWFAPQDLIKHVETCQFKRVYVPFWMFEVDGVSQYSCVVNFASPLGGNCYRSGTLEATSVTMCALDGDVNEFIENISPWDLNKMEKMTLRHKEKLDEELLASYSAEALWEEKGIKFAERKAREFCEQQIQKESRNSKITNLKIDLNVKRIGQKKVFLPMYYTTYTYNGQNFAFYVNGATAKVYGTRPKCLMKTFTVAAFSLGAAVTLLLNRR